MNCFDCSVEVNLKYGKAARDVVTLVLRKSMWDGPTGIFLWKPMRLLVSKAKYAVRVVALLSFAAGY